MKNKFNLAKQNDRGLFGRSLSAIASRKGAYLGDTQVVLGLLSLLSSDAMKEAGGDNADAVQRIDKMVSDVADVFLGADQRYIPLPKWNDKQGGLVRFLRTEIGVDETDAKDVVRGALLEMINELLDIGSYADQPDVLPEHWQWQAREVLERYTKLFLGVSRVMQDVAGIEGHVEPAEADATEDE